MSLTDEPEYVPPTNAAPSATGGLAQEPVFTPPPGQGVGSEGPPGPGFWEQQPTLLPRALIEAGAQSLTAPFSAPESVLAFGYNLGTQTAPDMIGKPPLAPRMPYGPELVSRVLDPALTWAGLPPPQGTAANLEYGGLVGAGMAFGGPALYGKLLDIIGAAPETSALLSSQPVRRAVLGGTGGTAIAGEQEAGFSPELQMATGFGFGALGGITPGATRTTIAADAQKAALLRAEGVDINAGQVSGLNFPDITAPAAPKQWADAVAKRFGGSADADGYLPGRPRYDGGPAPMVDAETRINQLYSDARQGPDIPLLGLPGGPSPPLNQTFDTISARAQGTAWGGPVLDAINTIRRQAQDNGGVLSSAMAVDHVLTSGYLAGEINKYSSGPDRNAMTRQGLEDVRTALQQGLAAHATQTQLTSLATGSEYYKNWRTVQDATDPVSGRITPDSLAKSVARNSDYLPPGGGDLGALAEAGRRFVRFPKEEKAQAPEQAPSTGAALVNRVKTWAQAIAYPAVTAHEAFGLSPETSGAIGLLGVPAAYLTGKALDIAARRQIPQLPPVTPQQYYGRVLAMPPPVGVTGTPQRPELF